jgi:Cu+-exporting ATPase
MVTDPVCNMTVDEGAAAAKVEHKGKTYYFCSAGCKEAFEKDPVKYTGGTSGHEHSHH